VACTQTDPPGGSTGPGAESAIYESDIQQLFCKKRCAQHACAWHTSGEHLELAQLQRSFFRLQLDDDISERRLNGGSTIHRNGCSTRHVAWILGTHVVVEHLELRGVRLRVRQADDEIGSMLR